MGTDLELGPCLPLPKLAMLPSFIDPPHSLLGTIREVHLLAQGAANAGVKISDPSDDKDPHVRTGFHFGGFGGLHLGVPSTSPTLQRLVQRLGRPAPSLKLLLAWYPAKPHVSFLRKKFKCFKTTSPHLLTWTRAKGVCLGGAGSKGA